MKDFIGATVTAVDLRVGNEEGSITTDRGVLRFFHDQGCCELVQIEDITGDLLDLIGGVVVTFEARVSVNHSEPNAKDSLTWTFYEIRTTKGDVTIRWLGESNGYYSEDVEVAWTQTAMERK